MKGVTIKIKSSKVKEVLLFWKYKEKETKRKSGITRVESVDSEGNLILDTPSTTSEDYESEFKHSNSLSRSASNEFSWSKLESLPKNIQTQIFCFLSAKDLLSLSKTNKYFNRICEDDIYWDSLFGKDFPQYYLDTSKIIQWLVQSSDKTPKNLWKQEYHKRFLQIQKGNSHPLLPKKRELKERQWLRPNNIAKGKDKKNQHLWSAVKLPPEENINDWYAGNCKLKIDFSFYHSFFLKSSYQILQVCDFFNQMNLLWSSFNEFCTPSTCIAMNAGPKYEYLWADGVKVKKPINVTAPEYINYLFEWVQNQLEDETLFPTNGNFPKDFEDIVKNLFRKMARFYGHIYCQHSEAVQLLNLQSYLDISFKHFYLFIREFNLVESDQLIPLQRQIDKILKEEYKIKKRLSSSTQGSLEKKKKANDSKC